MADSVERKILTGPASKCKPFRELIVAKLAAGLTAQRIHQDLGGKEIGFGYDSVRRFIQRLGRVHPLPFRRMECSPGEEAQVDFGTGVPVIGPDGKRRKTHVFRIVLSHSRKAYSEPTFTQTTDDFLCALENAFEHFGGVPKTLVIDNLKAAVLHPDHPPGGARFDPVLTPKIQSFCQHYGTVILPTKPRMPRHKRKVEAGVKYVQSNGLQGHTLSSLEEQRQHLLHWERTVREQKSLDEFDFAFNPSIKRAQIFDLATCRFIREAQDVLLVGPPGTGKSFLAQALGNQAIKQGFLVLYRSIFDVVRDFLNDEVLGGDDKMLARYLKPDLVIIDDMGMKQLPRRSGEVLFEIIMRRYENHSTMMTSNRPLEDWGKLIGDVPSATAILDRFLHHATIIPISGKSYRLRNQNSQPAEPDDNSKPANPPTGSPAKKKSKSDSAKSTDEAA